MSVEALSGSVQRNNAVRIEDVSADTTVGFSPFNRLNYVLSAFQSPLLNNDAPGVERIRFWFEPKYCSDLNAGIGLITRLGVVANFILMCYIADNINRPGAPCPDSTTRGCWTTSQIAGFSVYFCLTFLLYVYILGIWFFNNHLLKTIEAFKDLNIEVNGNLGSPNIFVNISLETQQQIELTYLQAATDGVTVAARLTRLRDYRLYSTAPLTMHFYTPPWKNRNWRNAKYEIFLGAFFAFLNFFLWMKIVASQNIQK